MGVYGDSGGGRSELRDGGWEGMGYRMIPLVVYLILSVRVTTKSAGGAIETAHQCFQTPQTQPSIRVHRAAPIPPPHPFLVFDTKLRYPGTCSSPTPSPEYLCPCVSASLVLIALTGFLVGRLDRMEVGIEVEIRAGEVGEGWW